jgi:hypothetical protein
VIVVRSVVEIVLASDFQNKTLGYQSPIYAFATGVADLQQLKLVAT